MPRIFALILSLCLCFTPLAFAEESPPFSVAQMGMGLQTVDSNLLYDTYPTLVVQAGIPVLWTIHATAETLNACNDEILIPAFSMQIPLVLGDNPLFFYPEEIGVVLYSCWMEMIFAHIVVVPDLAAVDFDAVQAQIDAFTLESEPRFVVTASLTRKSGSTVTTSAVGTPPADCNRTVYYYSE